MADKRQKPDFEPTVENRKARRDYLVLETLETGIVLRGTEIKSVRQAHVALGEAFVEVSKRGELWLVNARIDEYFQAGSYFNHSPGSKRKLLAHKHEIAKLQRAVEQKGMALVPLKLYFVRGRAKILVGLCKGKKMADKRQTLIDREHQRDVDRLSKARGMRI